MHIRDAWNATIAAADAGLRLERQRIVLTVPASFDEEARELTVEAARQAQFAHLTLLEEPIAAFYAWIAEHHTVDRAAPGAPAFPATVRCPTMGSRWSATSAAAPPTSASSASASRPAPTRSSGSRLAITCCSAATTSIWRWRRGSSAGLPNRGRRCGWRLPSVRRCGACAVPRRSGCSATRRRTGLPITVLGAGRTVIGAAITTDLTREDVQWTLDEFLPITAPGEIAIARDRRAGLRELGLPYETDPAITRHLAGFLARAARRAGVRAARSIGGRRRQPARRASRHRRRDGGGAPDDPSPARALQRRVLHPGSRARPCRAGACGMVRRAAQSADAPATWRRRSRSAPRPTRRLRAGIGPSMPLVKAGSGRAYYIGLRAPLGEDATPAVCVLSRGTDEGTTIRLEHPFTVATNRPISFSLYSSTIRSDRAGDIVSLQPGDDAREHAPLVTVLRYGRKSRQVDLPVRLSVAFTEVGILELWCESQASEHRVASPLPGPRRTG